VENVSPPKTVVVQEMNVDEIEYMPPTPEGSILFDLIDVDIPFEPAAYEPIDWALFCEMKQDVVGYFIETDEFGKSAMDYFVEKKMDFGNDEELPIGPTMKEDGKPAIPGKGINISKNPSARAKAQRIASSKASHPAVVSARVKAPNRPRAKSMHLSMPLATPNLEKFVREDMRDEIAELEREELRLCKEDDYVIAFDLT
jgi:hypothetical protein